MARPFPSALFAPASASAQEFRSARGPLLAAMLGYAFSFSGILLYNLGTLSGPIRAEFGWSLSQFSLAPMLILGGTVLGGPIAGFLLDRYSARRVAPVAFILLALVAFGLSRMNGSIAVFATLMLLVPLLGSGAAGLAYWRVINSWFSAARGLALGLIAAAVSVMSIIGPPVTQAVIDASGWRSAFLLGAACFAVAAPVMYFFLLERTQVAGDGAAPAQAALEALEARSVPFKAALKSLPFWLLTGQSMAIGMVISALMFHNVPFLVAEGIERSQAVWTMSLFGLSSLVGRIVMGWIFDRVHAALACAAVFGAAVLALLVLAASGAQYALPCVMVTGLMLGAEVDASGYLTARYFGMKDLAKITAVMFAAAAPLAGAGSVLMSQVVEHGGGYRPAMAMMAGITLVGGVLIALLVRRPFLDAGVAVPVNDSNAPSASARLPANT